MLFTAPILNMQRTSKYRTQSSSSFYFFFILYISLVLLLISRMFHCRCIELFIKVFVCMLPVYMTLYHRICMDIDVLVWLWWLRERFIISVTLPLYLYAWHQCIYTNRATKKKHLKKLHTTIFLEYRKVDLNKNWNTKS